jgi:hypothetical protein
LIGILRFDRIGCHDETGIAGVINLGLRCHLCIVT